MQNEPLSSIAAAKEDQPTINHLSSIALATEDQPLVSLKSDEPGREMPARRETLNQLPATSDFGLRTSDFNLPPEVIDTRPLPATLQPHKARRKGRVACLPKLQRDMVNRMLSNGVPYKNIVAALDEAGFNVTERNISNWATGGHLEWRFEQDLVLQNRLDQDHLLDHLRREDASELPEVGLQAAATRLSQILLLKTARADEVEANLGAFSQMVDVLCRLNREIAALQKQRDDSRRTLGRAYDSARIKEEDQMSAIENERFYSDPPGNSTLAKPAVPPALPPIPTSSTLAQADREAKETSIAEHRNSVFAMLQAFKAKKAPAPIADSPRECSAAPKAFGAAGSSGVPSGDATTGADETQGKPLPAEAAR